MAQAANTSTNTEIPSDDEPLLMWTVWPARTRPLATCGVILVVLVVAVFATIIMQTVIAGLLAALFLVHSLRGFFFPTIYRIDPTGVSTQCLAHRKWYPWRRIRRFRYDADGAFLSTRAGGTFLDRFAGMHLTWNRNHEDAVPLIEHYRQASQGNHDREIASCGTV